MLLLLFIYFFFCSHAEPVAQQLFISAKLWFGQRALQQVEYDKESKKEKKKSISFSMGL